MGIGCSTEGCKGHCGRNGHEKDASRNDSSCQKHDFPAAPFTEETVDSEFLTQLEQKRSELPTIAEHGSSLRQAGKKITWNDGPVKEEKLQMNQEKLPLKEELQVDDKITGNKLPPLMLDVTFDIEGEALKDGEESPEEKLRENPTSSPTSSPKMGGHRASELWKKAARKALQAKNMGAKVHIENKIGKKLEGWFRDVGLELQRGIAAEGRGQVHGSFEAPEHELFNRARNACGFPNCRYFATMGLQDGLTEPNLKLIGGDDAAGKSGSFFFLSPDQQLIAKSCTNEDWRQLLRILKHYVEYLEAARARAGSRGSPNGSSSPNRHGVLDVRGFTETLLPRFLGLYRLQVKGYGTKGKGAPVLVLVMANVFGGALSIDRRYDLKGSTHGRKASKKERAKKAPTYKDIDWVAAEIALGLSAMNRAILLRTITLDLDFLAQSGLMDYSLLVGVHDIDKDAPRPYEAMNVVTVRDQSRHCYLGIIDVLTPYKICKSAETFFMGKLVCGRDISCQHPMVYARRFLRFVDEKVFDLMDEDEHSL